MASDDGPDISDERLDEIDEIAEMMSEGGSGTTSEGTKVEAVDEEQLKNKERWDVLLFTMSYVSTPILIMMITGAYFFGVYPAMDALAKLIPLVVMIFILKIMVNQIAGEPWHGVLYSHVRWYQWWWRI